MNYELCSERIDERQRDNRKMMQETRN